MEEKIYDYWVATLQNGYIGNLIDLAEAVGGAKSLYMLFRKHVRGTDISKILDEIVMTNEDRVTSTNIVGETVASSDREYRGNKVMFTKSLRTHISNRWKNEDIIKNEYDKMIQSGIVYVNHSDSDFPARLLNISGTPYGLFVKGALPKPDKKSIAIVGARECSEYGRACAEYFGDRLAREGVQVISGMAWGIDGIAQMAAVLAGGNSFGVLGCGADVIYPRKNSRLYERLCDGGNGIISEYAPGTNAEARLFPPRNRIISGLCDALLVIEARAQSGTLITVSMAIEQGKTVLALPGRITDELSRGCLMLIEDGAVPAISVERVLGELSMGSGQLKCSAKDNRKTEELQDVTQRRVYDCLSLDPMSVDDICEKTSLGISEILVALTFLESKGYSKEVGPGDFVRGTTF